VKGNERRDGVAMRRVYPSPPGGIDLLWMAAGPDASWFPSTPEPRRVAFARLSYDGAWSWYAEPTPFELPSNETTSTAVAANGTVWMAYQFAIGVPGSPLRGAGLFSFAPTRIITAKPSHLLLRPSVPAIVRVRESNYAGSYSSTVRSTQNEGSR
jgi:hypothetical protein